MENGIDERPDVYVCTKIYFNNIKPAIVMVEMGKTATTRAKER